MKSYHYFVAYFYANPDQGGFRCVNAEIELAEPVTSLADIAYIAKAIKDSQGYAHEPTLLNYQLLRVEEVDA